MAGDLTRVCTPNPDATQGDIKVNQLQSISDENIGEIAANLIDENDGTFDLRTEAGIDEACRRSVSYYNSHGFELKHADIKRELNQQIKAKKLII